MSVSCALVVPGVEVVDFAEEDLHQRLKELTGGPGPDVGIAAIGMHYAKSILSKVCIWFFRAL